MFWFKPKREHPTDDERRIIDLLLSGATSFLEVLRKQWVPPFYMWIRRRRENNHELSLVFDGSRENLFSAGKKVSIAISDLVILDDRVGKPFRVIGSVGKGLLHTISLVSDAPIKWPSKIRLDDWGFLESDSGDWKAALSRKARVVIQKYDIPVRKPSSRPRPLWIAEDKKHDPAEGADESDIAAFEKEIGFKLPADYVEFLRWADGGTFGHKPILGTRDAYLLDEPFEPGLLVLSLDELGVVVLDLRTGAKYGHVATIDEGESAPEWLAASFKEWMNQPEL